jgi:hypothetical protein
MVKAGENQERKKKQKMAKRAIWRKSKPCAASANGGGVKVMAAASALSDNGGVRNIGGEYRRKRRNGENQRKWREYGGGRNWRKAENRRPVASAAAVNGWRKKA